MNLIYQILRISILTSLLWAGALFSSNTLAQFCDPNVSPTASCSNLELSNSDLNIVIPNGVDITGVGAALNVSSSSSNSSVTNNGSIDARTELRGVYNEGLNFTFINSGAVQGYTQGILNQTDASIVQIINIGTVTSLSEPTIENFGLINTIINSGTISGDASGIFNAGEIANITNNNLISATDSGYAIYNSSGLINNLINNGSITANSDYSGAIFNDTGRIEVLTNNGTLTSGNYGRGIENYEGEINTLINAGRITVGDNGYGIDSGDNSSITILSNSGSITAGNTGRGIFNSRGSGIATLSNSGTIIAGDSGWGIGNFNLATITTLTNTGTISVGANGVGINNYDAGSPGTGGNIATLNNSGSISAGVNGNGIQNTGSATIAMLNNSGTISAGVNGNGIYNGGTIGTLNNSGSISASGAGGYGIQNLVTITILTNNGSISGGGAGIVNVSGGLTTLNNAQGGNGSSPATTALTYRGASLENYNIIINSSTHYGQIVFLSPGGSIERFGIYGTPFITSRTYASVLTGTGGVNVGNSSGTYDNMTWSLVENGADVYDLIFTGVSLMGTQQSLVNTASVLQGTFTLQNSVMVNGFTYDCSLFDKRGICVSAGGRNTTVQAQGINNTSGLLIASYRLNKNNSRIGAWVDQNLSVSGPGTVQLGNSTPMIGLFGVWSQRPDGVGAEVKVSAAYGQKDTTITRQIVGLSEAGSGGSQLISQGAQVVAKYGFAVLPDVVVSPYAGVRYTQNNMGGYTEATSSAVTAPLTYSALNTNATTALAGAEARYRGIPKTTLFASAGVETDTNTSNGSYSATGVTGLTPVNFNPNPVKTRPTATVGGYYDILKNQRIGITGIYRQEAYQAVSTTTVLATYTIGL